MIFAVQNYFYIILCKYNNLIIFMIYIYHSYTCSSSKKDIYLLKKENLPFLPLYTEDMWWSLLDGLMPILIEWVRLLFFRVVNASNNIWQLSYLDVILDSWVITFRQELVDHDIFIKSTLNKFLHHCMQML